MASDDSILDAFVTVSPCPICNGISKTRHVLIYANEQIWQCEAGHTILLDASGKKILGVEMGIDLSSWRSEFDRKRETTYNPNAQSWSYRGERRQRRLGGKGSHNYNFYVNPEEQMDMSEDAKNHEPFHILLEGSTAEPNRKALFSELEQLRNGLNDTTCFLRSHRWSKTMGVKDHRAVDKIQRDLLYLLGKCSVMLQSENDQND